MANADTPNGFKPYGKIRQAIRCEAGSTVYPGDCVKLAADGQVDVAAAGDALLGVALEYATVGNKMLVSVHPEQLYVGQADETELSGQTVVGTLCDIVATAGNSTYLASRMEIDSSTSSDGGGNDSGQLVIIGLEERPDNAWGAQAKVIVKINEHQLKDGFAGI
jgi:hypothetical protein